MQNMPIAIFRGDDTDALGYQTIVGTIRTDLDLTGCKAVFKYLSFSVEFNPIPADKKLTVIIPSSETSKFPPGLGYASLRVYDAEGKLCTFSNRIMVFVATKTPMFGNEEFEVDFNVRPELEPLKIFVGPNPDDFDEYRGFLEKVIDRASAAKYGLAMLLDAIDSDLGADDGVAATPVAVKAAYAAVIKKLTDDYYTKEETDEAIDRVAAYYITYDAAGNPFPTYAALANATTVYSGGKVRVPTRNDYCVVLADETHQGAEYRYIYAVAEGQTTGSWQPQFPVEGVMTVDQTVTKDSTNPVASSGIWSAIWGALASLPTGFTSLYDWCVAQLAGKASKSDVDPLLFAQYYPDGSVKSAAEFTSGIKYDAPDTTNRTITVKPFCNTGTADDNSNLAGRVVIPPFVDAQGNGYISDDGTRYKVVAVSDGIPRGVNANLTAIIAPNTVTNVGTTTFGDCTSLTSVSLPAATTIEENAFDTCTSLTTVSLPAATRIRTSAFAGCTSLTSVSLPAATTIEGTVFGVCTSLTSVSLPVVTNIEIGAFIGCTSLTSVDFGDTPRSSVPSLGSNAFYNVPTSCKIIVPYTQYDAWKVASGWSSLTQEFVRHAEKADKPATFTEGNLAEFDANGNPVDSHKKPSDFQSALSAQQLANIAAVPDKLDKSGGTMTGSLTLYEPQNGAEIYFPSGGKAKLQFGSGLLNVDDTTGRVTINQKDAVTRSATFTAGNLVQLTQDGGITDSGVKASDKLDSTSVAPAFTAKAYAADEACTYNGVRYKCILAYTATAQSTKPDADSTHWTAETVQEALSSGGGSAGGIPADAHYVYVNSLGQVCYNPDQTGGGGGSYPSGTSLSFAIAPEFSTSATYAVGSVVMYAGLRYICTTAVSTAGEWTGSTNWTEQPLQEVLGDIEGILDTINNGSQS